jgi:Domain of Unknown Function (DUF1080)
MRSRLFRDSIKQQLANSRLILWTGSEDCFMTERPFSETARRSIQLFNGVNLNGWRQAGPGRFRIEDGMLVTEGGMGLLWYSARQFGNFELP